MTPTPALMTTASRVAATFLALAAFAGPAQAVQRQTWQVTMRDGVALATDVWLPDGEVVPRAALLRRTPYGREAPQDLVALVLTAGYALVSQDVRGRGGSGGEYVPFRNDALDGADTIAWIAAQPFSNGKVGTASMSAEAIVQLLAAGEAPPALRCAHVGFATGDMREAMLPGGAWRKEMSEQFMSWMDAAEALDGFRAYEADSAWWDPLRLDAAERSRIAIPIMMYGGFFDVFAAGTTRTFSKLQQEVVRRWRDDQFLLMGPWSHTDFMKAQQGELLFERDAVWETGAFASEMAAFFEWCLGDLTRPAWDPVRYYLTRIGDDGLSAGGEWRGAPIWPPESTLVRMQLQPDGTLTDAPAPAGGEPASLPVDPEAPVPTRGGGNLGDERGPYDQSEIDARTDVLVTQTPAATVDAELAGEVEATIWAASATTDVDVVVRLSQVTPAGRALLLADGVRRGRFVGGEDAIRPLVPGVAAPFAVALGPVAFTLPAGHALRLAVAGTSDPRIEANPGVAEPLASRPAPVATVLTVFRDEARPSSVTLPLIAGELPGTGFAPPDAGMPEDAGPVDGQPGDGDGDGGCGCASGPGPLSALGALPLFVLLRRRRAAAG